MHSDFTQAALGALDAVLAADSDSNLKSNRISRLILSPDTACEGWTMRVTDAFLDALDVKLTPRTVAGVTSQEWTSGSWFSFAEGGYVS